MINKESKDKKKTKPNDITRTDVSAHLIIKDKDTGKVLINKRG